MYTALTTRPVVGAWGSGLLGATSGLRPEGGNAWRVQAVLELPARNVYCAELSQAASHGVDASTQMLVYRHRHKGAGKGLLTVCVGWLLDYENFAYLTITNKGDSLLLKQLNYLLEPVRKANATAAIADTFIFWGAILMRLYPCYNPATQRRTHWHHNRSYGY